MKDKRNDQIPPVTPAEERRDHHLSEGGIEQHNREVNEGLKNNKERLVDIGRGEQTKGRGKS